MYMYQCTIMIRYNHSDYHMYMVCTRKSICSAVHHISLVWFTEAQISSYTVITVDDKPMLVQKWSSIYITPILI